MIKKGFKHSDKSIHKIRMSNKGKKRTQQTRDRISRAMTGRILSE
jgi:hypothetical protein